MATAKPVFLNNVASTVQAGSSAIGSATATGVNVATGEGANFGTINTDEYIPAVIVDTSTSPETVKEYVWITARSTDALTIVRQAEDATRYAASTTSIQSGYTIAAVHTRVTDDLRAELRGRYLKPDAALVQNIDRWNINADLTNVSLGSRIFMCAIALPAGLQIGHIAFTSGSTAASSPTHWWFGLYDQSRVQLAVTADQATAAWGTQTTQSLAIATTAGGAATSFTTTYTGLHFVGINFTGTTAPSLIGANLGNQGNAMNFNPAISFAGNVSSGLSNPQTFPFTATVGANGNAVPWCFVGA